MRPLPLAPFLVLIASCPTTSASRPETPVAATFDATVELNINRTRPVNRRILGNNVQWTDHGDNLLIGGTTRFKSDLLELVKQISPTVLRYPGGGQADLFHWRQSVGAADRRGTGEHLFSKQKQKVLFGTGEFLQLAELVGAEPLITVNVVSGTADEAAAWVKWTNIDRARAPSGNLLPRVRYWEIGNEPYLKGRPELEITPEEFARRATLFIRAMKAVDPTIEVGLPIITDTTGRRPSVDRPNFARRVLPLVHTPYDWVATHNAYHPLLWDGGRPSDEQLYRATMAGSRVVEKNLERLTALLGEYRPGWRPRIGITEYNAFFSLQPPQDKYTNTLGGALYVADVLRAMAYSEGVVLACFWSLTDNWVFGAFTSGGEAHPSAQVFYAYTHVLRGQLVPTRYLGPTFDAPAVGSINAEMGLPLLTSLATLEGETLRVLLINKDPSRAARVRIAGMSRSVSAVSAKLLSGPRIFSDITTKGTSAWQDRPIGLPALPATVELPAHSIGWLEFALH